MRPQAILHNVYQAPLNGFIGEPFEDSLPFEQVGQYCQKRDIAGRREGDRCQ
jgi:hypothetical protein